MISIKHDQSSLGLTVVWLLLAFTPFLRITSAASLPPQQFLSNGISPTANEPGIGVEIEMGKLTILKTNGGEFTLEEKDKAKGTEMVTTGFPGAPKTHWRLTAEIGGYSLSYCSIFRVVLGRLRHAFLLKYLTSSSGNPFSF